MTRQPTPEGSTKTFSYIRESDVPNYSGETWKCWDSGNKLLPSILKGSINAHVFLSINSWQQFAVIFTSEHFAVIAIDFMYFSLFLFVLLCLL